MKNLNYIVILKNTAIAFFKARVFCVCLSGVISANVAAADKSVPVEQNNADTNNTTNNTAIADESPMMLYLVPWNANPESGKNGKKFSLYQPWGTHFDPLTPEQTIQLNAQ
ncbi:MAG TPA: hypothetical protein VIZ65_16345 [Cellvibrionaceae bacterium]